MSNIIEKKLNILPNTSGVYIMLDRHNNIIYIGKAKNLKARVNQYFSKAVKNKKTALLVGDIKDFDYILTKSELEALVLENSLIKLHQPFYNILLKDDKTYPYLKFNLGDEFPFLEIVRVIKNDGSLYFGPYMRGITASGLLDIIHSIFPIRSCKGALNKSKSRGCLKSFIGTCLAPCVNSVTQKNYGKIVKEVIRFLEGDDRFVRETIKNKIKMFSEQEDFETAIEQRDKLYMLDKIKREQIANISRDISIDVFVGLANQDYSVITVLNVRAGTLIGVQNIQTYSLLDSSEFLSSYITQYYEINPILVKEIAIFPGIEFSKELEEHLSNIKGEKVIVNTPKRGAKKHLVDFALKNAEEYSEKIIVRNVALKESILSSLSSLKEDLELISYPRRIECYDISNWGASDKVGSMVVFNNGEIHRKHYRKFRIRSVKGVDDYASMAEVISRRINALNTDDVSFSERPDLIIIDGGKGHLSTVSPIISPCKIPFICIAEESNHIYMLKQENPLILHNDSLSLKMIQVIRDEAHRFANTYQANLSAKAMFSSNLLEIPQIGPALSKALILHFKTVESIKHASIEQLIQVPGIGEKKAIIIKRFFETLQ